MEKKVARTRRAARVAKPEPALIADAPEAEPVEVPTTVSVSMTSLQRARYEALMEQARKQGIGSDRAEVLLAALGDLVAGEKAPGATLEVLIR